jgi:hypothetical protein
MIDELNKALSEYQTKWHRLVGERKDKHFFEALKITAVGWKTEDFAELQRRFHTLRDSCDQIHLGWLNDRWIATMHLRDQKLHGNIEVIKLMQRRPGSKDAVGLDHLDFLTPEGQDAKTVLSAEPNLKWTEEKNGEFCKWISIWFDNTEAKLRSDTTIDVCIAEMQAISKQVTGTA